MKTRKTYPKHLLNPPRKTKSQPEQGTLGELSGEDSQSTVEVASPTDPHSQENSAKTDAVAQNSSNASRTDAVAQGMAVHNDMTPPVPSNYSAGLPPPSTSLPLSHLGSLPPMPLPGAGLGLPPPVLPFDPGLPMAPGFPTLPQDYVTSQAEYSHYMATQGYLP